ncbi:MAG: hypothetical protein Q9227_002606 [Pyrenula ochraceoflavens]
MSRPRRAGATQSTSSSVTVSRSPSSSPDDRRKSIRLTVKMPSSKLREVTNSSSAGLGDSGQAISGASRRNIGLTSRDSFEGGEILSGSRSRNAKKPVAYREVEEDEDEDDEEIDEEEEDEDEQEEEDEELNDYARVGAEAEATDDDVDAEGEEDVDMQDAPVTVPTIIKNPPAKARGSKVSFQRTSKPLVKVTPFEDAQLKPVEEKEMEVDDEGEEEELSEVQSGGEEEEQDETGIGDEDAEGEEEDLEGDLDAEGDEDGLGELEEDEEVDSDDETPGSGTSTPDINKLTKRQRGRMDEGGDFLALPMEPQVKKILTADEHRMRRAEMARRRKNLSEKRNEEEKMTTINKLLKKQAPKRRGKAPNPETVSSAMAGDMTPNSQEAMEVEKANPLYTRWVSNREGIKLGVPEEWLGKKFGRLFGDPPEQPSPPGLLVEEVEG